MRKMIRNVSMDSTAIGGFMRAGSAMLLAALAACGGMPEEETTFEIGSTSEGLAGSSCGRVTTHEFRLGDSLTSCDGRTVLSFSSRYDGNMVVLRDGALKWSVARNGGRYFPAHFLEPGYIQPDKLLMQGDGNLVIYAANGKALWDSQTWGNPGAFLAVQNDGNVVIYSSSHKPLWWSWQSFDGPRGTLIPTGTQIKHAYAYSPDGGTYLAQGNLLYRGLAPTTWSVAREIGVNMLPWGSLTWMQPDGDLVTVAPDGALLWHSNTAGNPGSRLLLQNDGNLVIYSPTRGAIWDAFSRAAALRQPTPDGRLCWFRDLGYAVPCGG